MAIVEFIKQNLIGDLDLNLLTLRVLLALGIIILGVICGKLVNSGLKKLFQKLELEKKIKIGILDLFRAIVRWCIYTVFLIWGLSQLGITDLTKSITSVLIIIPAFIGALIVIIIGFSVAYFLRRIIKESGIKGIEGLSEVVFYFVIYIAGIYAMKTALISFGEQLANYLIMILTGAFGVAIAYFFIRKQHLPVNS